MNVLIMINNSLAFLNFLEKLDPSSETRKQKRLKIINQRSEHAKLEWNDLCPLLALAK